MRLKPIIRRWYHANIGGPLKNLFARMKYPAPPPVSTYLAICCISKDENEYLPEFIDYHRKIGVEKFYLYDNESKIPIAETLAPLVAEGVVVVNTISGKGVQTKAYQQCLESYGADTRWIAFIDTDEFIVPKVTNNLPELMREYEAFGGLGINWLLFGSSGHMHRPAESQVTSFVLHTTPDYPPNRHIKSIVQPYYVVRTGLNPHEFVYKRFKFCVNEHFRYIRGAHSPHSTRLVQLNHYFLRSQDEFRLKIERGRGDGAGTRCMDDFFRTDKECQQNMDKSIIALL